MGQKETDNKRYGHQMSLPGFGPEGQQKLSASRVMVIGAGGLGCPVLQYLAAAGVGTLGIADADTVALSNLHRQVLYTEADIGKPKAAVAAGCVMKMNPGVEARPSITRLTASNIRSVLSGYHLIIDCTDNFASRYLISDASAVMRVPLLSGSLYRFSGQVSFLNCPEPGGSRSPGYRDMFPFPPSGDILQPCQVSGILGPVAGMIGTILATEAIMFITGAGVTLAGKLLVADLSAMEMRTFQLTTRSGTRPATWKDIESFDYETFCNGKPVLQEMSSAELVELMASGEPVQFIDIREGWELEESGMPDQFPVIHIPMEELTRDHGKLSSEATTVLLCENGNRSKLVLKYLTSKGHRNVYGVRGGLQALKGYGS